jgi:hypothetical protein
MERERTEEQARFSVLDPAVAAERLAAQRRRRDDASLARAARELLSEAKRRQRRSDRRSPPVEPMSLDTDEERPAGRRPKAATGARAGSLACMPRRLCGRRGFGARATPSTP